MLNQFQFSSNHKLVSFDVTSLFTNVPLNETIWLIADTIFSDGNPNVLFCVRGIFVKLLHIATTGMFLYQDKLFQQIDGVAMGLLLGPTLAIGKNGEKDNEHCLSESSFIVAVMLMTFLLFLKLMNLASSF